MFPTKRKVVVAGVGVNCLGGPEQFPGELSSMVTTLEAQGVKTPPGRLLRLLVEELDRRLVEAAEMGYHPIYGAWNRRCPNLGRRVEVVQGDRRMVGVLQGLDQEGRLVIKREEGSVALEGGTLRYLG